MTARHSAAVARYSREIAAAAGLSSEEQELVHIGRAAARHRQVRPPRQHPQVGRRELTDADWEEIKKHPYEGARIVSQIDGYQPVGEIILAHHERIDGLGYPRGLEGDEIPLLARVISVADTYDVHDRPRLLPRAGELIRGDRSSCAASPGTQLDSRFVEVFVEMLDGKDLAYRHGEDADFEAELALDKRIHDYVAQTPSVAERARAPLASRRPLASELTADRIRTATGRPRGLVPSRARRYRILIWLTQPLRKPMVHLLDVPVTRQTF